MSIQRFASVLALGLALSACAQHGDPEGRVVSNDASAWSHQSAPQWQPAGLAAQPRLQALRDALPDDPVHTPEVTDWAPVGDGHPARAFVADGATADTPAALLARVADVLPENRFLGKDIWEQTRRLLRDDEGHAVGVVLHWGMKDDALAGRDYRLRMEPDGEQWRLIAVDTRLQCRRGISDEGICQ
ncbi:hypothetical protein HC341_18000 [Aquisalimonas sp. 2447]|uniref:hypothetical protein n=1 Tax=Aquisalimonas sp. 2447 TaxID=2740807 RepID=UPI0014326676|nr:hypothetical protein [Aquisalimonas sp. 2447]QIT56924.1 hypothetical protein HC341_18000 [Aquisalimonas sp. 2447]